VTLDPVWWATTPRHVDADLIEAWSDELDLRGWSRRSIERATRRVRAFARDTPNGLVRASKDDVVRFATSRARGRHLLLTQFTRTDSWRQSVWTLKLFYDWTVRHGYRPRSASPFQGLLVPPARPTGAVLGPRDAHLFEKTLHVAGLNVRERAILYLLAHGLTPAQVTAQRIEDVDILARHVTVRDRGRRWTVPLTDAAASVLLAHITTRCSSGERVGWLFPVRAGRPKLGGRRGLPASIVGTVVHRAAALAFPLPSQAAKRRRVRPIGFRQLYLQRVIRTRITAAAILDLTRFSSTSSLRRFAPNTPDEPRRELLRVARRFKHWLCGEVHTNRRVSNEPSAISDDV
jgi:integrase